MSDAAGFHLAGADQVWTWQNGRWRADPLPPGRNDDGVVGLGATQGRTLYVTHKGACVFFLLQCSYEATWREDDRGDAGTRPRWSTPVALPTVATPRAKVAPWFVEELASTRASVYLRTSDGRLLRLRPPSASTPTLPVATVAGPAGTGPCEAITRTSDGELLASFRPGGIFRFDEPGGPNGGAPAFRPVLDLPYPDGEGEHRAYLAEDHGRIALAVEPVPRMLPNSREFGETGRHAVWFADGQGSGRAMARIDGIGR